MTARHLPTLMYGPLDDAATMLDEIGSDATVAEVSSAVCNVMRAAAAQLRTLDKLAAKLIEIEDRQARLERNVASGAA